MKYSNEEKLSIVARCQQGESVAALSNELAIPRSTLYRWIKSFPTDSAGKPLKFSYQEYTLLQRKVEKLQNVITILKSADCLVSAPLKERLYALEPFYGKYEVHTICEALDVDRGTFYNHMIRNKRENAWFEKRRQEYCQLIRDVFDEYQQVLGAEKIQTMKEITEYLGVSRDTVLNWIEKRNMPAAKIGRLWKFKISEVDAWMKSGKSAK